MRVISGRLGGRLFDSPGGQRTHPMSDKARGALFNTLGDITGLSVLDAFGGTGAISIEAISRGAKQATIVESDRRAQKTIGENINSLGIQSQIQLIKANTSSWRKKNSREKFNIVISDPPYNDLQEELLEDLINCVATGGIYVLSFPGKLHSRKFTALQEMAKKDYGDIQLVFYKQVS
jgi:16S rRNA (guanine966-N2)-methyltransferase